MVVGVGLVGGRKVVAIGTLVVCERMRGVDSVFVVAMPLMVATLPGARVWTCTLAEIITLGTLCP